MIPNFAILLPSYKANATLKRMTFSFKGGLVTGIEPLAEFLHNYGNNFKRMQITDRGGNKGNEAP